MSKSCQLRMNVDVPIAIPAKPNPTTNAAGSASRPHHEWMSPSAAIVITKPVE